MMIGSSIVSFLKTSLSYEYIFVVADKLFFIDLRILKIKFTIIELQFDWDVHIRILLESVMPNN